VIVVGDRGVGVNPSTENVIVVVVVIVVGEVIINHHIDDHDRRHRRRPPPPVTARIVHVATMVVDDRLYADEEVLVIQDGKIDPRRTIMTHERRPVPHAMAKMVIIVGTIVAIVPKVMITDIILAEPAVLLAPDRMIDLGLDRDLDRGTETDAMMVEAAVVTETIIKVVDAIMRVLIMIIVTISRWKNEK